MTETLFHKNLQKKWCHIVRTIFFRCIITYINVMINAWFTVTHYILLQHPRCLCIIQFWELCLLLLLLLLLLFSHWILEMTPIDFNNSGLERITQRVLSMATSGYHGEECCCYCQRQSYYGNPKLTNNHVLMGCPSGQ